MNDQESAGNLSPTPSFRRPTLSRAIRHYVKQYILDAALSAGDLLPPEGELAQQLGVGRSSVREAIRALESLGIVEVRHGNGIYVREYNFDPVLETISFGMHFDTKTLAELTQIRIWLEAAVVEEAVNRATPEVIARLEAILAGWADRIQAGEEASDLDEQFHRTLYGSLNNDTLMKLFEVFWIAFENLQIETIHQADPGVELSDHQAILEAVKSRNAGLARRLLLKNFSHIQERIQRAAGPAA